MGVVVAGMRSRRAVGSGGGLECFPNLASQSLVCASADHGVNGLLKGLALSDSVQDQSGDGLSLGHELVGWWGLLAMDPI